MCLDIKTFDFFPLRSGTRSTTVSTTVGATQYHVIPRLYVLHCTPRYSNVFCVVKNHKNNVLPHKNIFLLIYNWSNRMANLIFLHFYSIFWRLFSHRCRIVGPRLLLRRPYLFFGVFHTFPYRFFNATDPNLLASARVMHIGVGENFKILLWSHIMHGN